MKIYIPTFIRVICGIIVSVMFFLSLAILLNTPCTRIKAASSEKGTDTPLTTSGTPVSPVPECLSPIPMRQKISPFPLSVTLPQFLVPPPVIVTPPTSNPFSDKK